MVDASTTDLRGDDAEQDLDQDQCGDDPEILHRRALRRSGGREQQGVALGQPLGQRLGLLRGVPEGEGADARQEKEDAHSGPDQRVVRDGVRDQRLVRPVVGVGHGVVGPLGAGCPGRPPEEGRERAQAAGIGLRAAWDRILRAALREYIGGMALGGGECTR
jgi:hypothetical protein